MALERKTVFLLTLFVFTACLQMIVQYNGNYHGFYFEFYQYLLSDFDGAFGNDIFIQGNYALDNTSLFWIVKIFRIDLDNDFIGLALHLLFGTLSVVCAYKIVFHFSRNDTTTALVVTLLLIFGDLYRLVDYARAGIISSHTGTPTAFAHQLVYPFLLLVLQKRHFAANCLLVAVFSLTMKETWILYPICITYVIATREIHGRAILFYVIPALFVVYKSIASHLGTGSLSPKDLVDLCRLVSSDNENSFHLHGYRLSLCFISFFLFFQMASRFQDRNLRSFLWSVLWITLLVVVLGGLYTWKGYEYWPNPLWIMLSPVRASGFYVTFFYMLFFIYILRSEIPSAAKVLLCIGFVRYGTYGRPVVFGIYCLILLGVSVSLYLDSKGDLGRRLRLWFLGTTNRLLSRPVSFFFMTPKEMTTLVTISAMLLTSASQLVRRSVEFDWANVQHLNNWTHPMPISDGLMKALMCLREQRRDYILIAMVEQPETTPFSYWDWLTKSGTTRMDTSRSSPSRPLVFYPVNGIARKSKFTGSVVSCYLDKNLYMKNQERITNTSHLLSEINASNLQMDTLRYFAQNQVYLLLPTRSCREFPAYAVVEDFGEFRLIATSLCFTNDDFG